MLRVTVELIPHGNELLKEILGEITIINSGTGTEEKGNYYIRAFDVESGLGKEGYINSYERKRLFWNLLEEVLRVINNKD